VGPSAVLDPVVKRKIRSLRRESNPRTQFVQSVAQRSSWCDAQLKNGQGELYLYINPVNVNHVLFAK